ncbi:DUF6124 family protein [Pseudomonas sp. CLCA07]
MFKATPNPPESDDRAPDHSLNPLKSTFPPRKPSTIYLIAPGVDTETLLVNACESLASASVMASDFAGLMEGPHRNTMLGIQQNIMLAELAVNRALDIVDPQ